MHKFKVGDRARCSGVIYPKNSHQIGTVCVIESELFISEGEPSYYVTVIGFPSSHESKMWTKRAYHLEPLNPPKQQETITWNEACFDRDGKFRIGVAV